jgi:hypothetical protein
MLLLLYVCNFSSEYVTFSNEKVRHFCKELILQRYSLRNTFTANIDYVIESSYI